MHGAIRHALSTYTEEKELLWHLAVFSSTCIIQTHGIIPICDGEDRSKLFLYNHLYTTCHTHIHSTKKPVTTMLTYPWKCTVLHCNHLGNTWKPLVLMTRHFDYCPSASEHGDNQNVGSSVPVVSRCFPGGYNVKLYISRGRLAWWLLAFLRSDCVSEMLPSARKFTVTISTFNELSF